MPVALIYSYYSFWRYHVYPKIRRGSPRAKALNQGVVGTNWRFPTNKPPYLRNSARYDKGYYWSLIGNHIRTFDWYQNQRPWLILKWPWTAIMHSVALHTCVWKPTTKICTKIDPHYQRQKCSPGILLSSMISFMGIFAGVCWLGRQMRVGWSKMVIFASFTRYIFRTFTSKATFIILCYVAP